MVKKLVISLVLSFNCCFLFAQHLKEKGDSVEVSFLVGDYSLVYHVNEVSSIIYQKSNILCVPYLKKKRSTIFVEDDYGDPRIKKIKCFEAFKYHIEIKNKKELEALFQVKQEELNKGSDNEKIKIKSITTVNYSNLKFATNGKERVINKELDNVKFKDLITRRVIRNGGYVKLYVKYEYKNKDSFLFLGVLYTGGNQEKIDKKYERYVRKGKILMDRNNPECAYYPRCK